MSTREFLEREHNRIGPAPGTDSAERLRHTLKVYEHEADDKEVMTATRNVYYDHHWTGITLGDLREILRRLDLNV